MRFAIDLDGTICIEEMGHTEEDYKNRTPRAYLVAKIRALYSTGHTIIIHSARHLEDFDITTAWLIKHEIFYHELILGKVSADRYVDTRNITPDQLFMDF